MAMLATLVFIAFYVFKDPHLPGTKIMEAGGGIAAGESAGSTASALAPGATSAALTARTTELQGEAAEIAAEIELVKLRAELECVQGGPCPIVSGGRSGGIATGLGGLMGGGSAPESSSGTWRPAPPPPVHPLAGRVASLSAMEVDGVKSWLLTVGGSRVSLEAMRSIGYTVQEAADHLVVIHGEQVWSLFPMAPVQRL